MSRKLGIKQLLTVITGVITLVAGINALSIALTQVMEFGNALIYLLMPPIGIIISLVGLAIRAGKEGTSLNWILGVCLVVNLVLLTVAIAFMNDKSNWYIM